MKISRNRVACDACRNHKKRCSGGPSPCARCFAQKSDCFIPSSRKKNQRLIDIEHRLTILEVEAKRLPPAQQFVSHPKFTFDYGTAFHNHQRELSRIYMKTFHLAYPFIDPQRIEKELISKNGDSLLINVVSCLVKRHLQGSARVCGKIQELPLLEKDPYYTRAISMFSLEIDDVSLETIQALLLLVVLECGCLLFERSSQHLAMAISKSQSVGLHLNNPYDVDISRNLKIERKAVWFICQFLDSTTSLYTNRNYISSSVYDGPDFNPDIGFDIPSFSSSPCDSIPDVEPETQGALTFKINFNKKEFNILKLTVYHSLVAQYRSRAMSIRRKFFRREIEVAELLLSIDLLYSNLMKCIPSNMVFREITKESISKEPALVTFYYLTLSLAADRLCSLLTQAKVERLSVSEVSPRFKEVLGILHILGLGQREQRSIYETVDWVPGVVLFALHELLTMFPSQRSNIFDPNMPDLNRISTMLSNCVKHWPLLASIVPDMVKVFLQFIS